MSLVLNRRQFLQRTLAAGSLSLLGVGAYSYLFEVHRPIVERVDIHLDRLGGPLKIAQLSDIHYGAYIGDKEVTSVVEMTNRLDPDVTVITGDFITLSLVGFTTHAVRDAELCARALGGLRARLGVFAALGNHDRGAGAVTRALQANGIAVLRNRAVPLELNQSRLWMAGVDDVLHGKPDLEKALQKIPSGETTILLVHEPDYADSVIRFPVDLQLSGHSHGGQVRLPLMGPPILPRLARKYPQGLRRIGRLQLYTNRGIGVIDPPVRVNCPPEVTLITVH